MDVVFLSRMQFALTAALHILFSTPTIGRMLCLLPAVAGICACFRLKRPNTDFQRKSLTVLLVATALLAPIPGSPAADASPVSLHHDLRVVLAPESQRLSGIDALTVKADGAASLVFQLSRTAVVHEVRIHDQNHPFEFKEGKLEVPLGADNRLESLLVTIKYSAVFADRAPEAPSNTDNPGFGVVGVISEKGAFLLAGSGWYPELSRSFPTFRLSVDAPAGVLAVSAGRSLGHESTADRTLSGWQVDHPLPGLSLSAGRYLLRERKSNRVAIATYFSQENDELSPVYLDTVAKYIGVYEHLIGPYPFEKFAVVENFFPTGYGFPSYTLLGSTVLRLPFILDTSLGHEIAHSWWGNGVLVDARGGNWCEGLTTYLSDYLYKERSSEAEAREYRLQILRNFTTLVTPDHDFPLSRFQSRYDPASQAIGYGKAAMVFHMLRRKLGEQAFWGALQEVYRRRLFQETSWKDLQTAFERQAGTSLEPFFSQWLSRKGAPRLTLSHALRERQGDGWVVTGEIKQELPLYALELNAAVAAGEQIRHETLSISRETNPIRINAPAQPLSATLDPGYDTFRHLAPEEIPPSVNSLKAASAVTVVLAEPRWEGMERVAMTLARSLGFEDTRMVPEAGLEEADLREHDLLFIGLPSEKHLPVKLPPGLILNRGSFVVEGRTFAEPSDAFFGVFSPTAGRRLGLFLPLSPASAGEVAGKITHYGRYGYLAFSRSRNEIKGSWPVTGSPLMVKWDE